MTYPENLGPGQSPFDLSATAGGRYGDPEELSRLYEDTLEPDNQRPVNRLNAPARTDLVLATLRTLNALEAQYGHRMAVVMMMTGLSADEINAVGGVGDD